MKNNRRGKGRTLEERQPQVTIGPSLYGTGVFADEDFFEEDVIGKIQGEVIDDADYESSYCMELDEEKKLEPAPPFRFLNHCCDPNCELVVFDDEPSDTLWLQVIRPILAGEELTIDYAWPADNAIPCECGDMNCRGWIVDVKELALVAELAQ